MNEYEYDDDSWQLMPCSECAGNKTCTNKNHRREDDPCKYVFGENICRLVVKHKGGDPKAPIYGYVLEGLKKHSFFGMGASSPIKCVDCGKIKVRGTRLCPMCEAKKAQYDRDHPFDAKAYSRAQFQSDRKHWWENERRTA